MAAIGEILRKSGDLKMRVVGAIITGPEPVTNPAHTVEIISESRRRFLLVNCGSLSLPCCSNLTAQAFTADSTGIFNRLISPDVIAMRDGGEERTGDDGRETYKRTMARGHFLLTHRHFNSAATVFEQAEAAIESAANPALAADAHRYRQLATGLALHHSGDTSLGIVRLTEQHGASAKLQDTAPALIDGIRGELGAVADCLRAVEQAPSNRSLSSLPEHRRAQARDALDRAGERFEALARDETNGQWGIGIPSAAGWYYAAELAGALDLAVPEPLAQDGPAPTTLDAGDLTSPCDIEPYPPTDARTLEGEVAETLDIPLADACHVTTTLNNLPNPSRHSEQR